MGLPERRRATYDDVLKAPEHVVAEIVGGELFLSPRPAVRHSNASSVLGGDLNPAFQRGRGGPGGWWVLFEPELHLRDDVLVPDLAGWRRERLPVLPDGVGIELAPDWVCEVASPSTTRLDRLRKMPVYAREGVGYIWLVDPIARLLEVFRLERARWVLLAAHGDDERVRAEPFEAIEIDLLALWGEERGAVQRG